MSKSKNKAVYGILFMVFIFFMIMMTFAVYTIKIFKSDSLKFETELNKGSKIGIVEVNGAIMDSKNTIELLHKAEKDPEIKAIILRVNSPGGAVGPTQEIYEEIRRIDLAYTESKKEKAKNSKDEEEEISIGEEDSKKKSYKPIYASFGSIAASGGYYIGAATRKIYSNGGTLTGSIGVILSFMDLSKLYEWAKVSPEVIKSGKYKDAGQSFRELTPEERMLLTSTSDNVHDQFINDILKTRKEKIKGDIRELAQGQIFSGEKALEYGLVDEIGSMWKAARSIHDELKLEGEMELKYVKLKKKPNWYRVLNKVESFVGKIEGISSGNTFLPMFMVR